jgi:hypothetical protein
MKKENCDYCEDEIVGKAYYDKQLEGWICENCKEYLKEQERKNK